MRKFTLFFMSLFLTIGAMAQVTDPAVMDVNTSKVYTIQFNNNNAFVYCNNGDVFYDDSFIATNVRKTNYQFTFSEAGTDTQGRQLYYIASVGLEGYYVYNENTTNEGGSQNSVGLTNDASVKTEKGVWYIFSNGSVQYIVPAWKESDGSFTRGGCCWNRWSTDNNKLGMWGRGTSNPNYDGENNLQITEFVPHYIHNSGSLSSRSQRDRKFNSFEITDGNNSLAVNNIQTLFTDPIYVDKSAEKFTTTAGATLSFSAFDYTGSWMHAYAYIDYNKDYSFELENNNNGTGTGEIVSYNYLNGKTITGTNGSQADAMTSVHNGSKTLPAFTLPADLKPGEYRMRIKIDWNNIDADLGASDIAANGGCQCDITIVIPHTLNVTSAGWATLFLDFPAAIPTVEDEEKGVFIATGMTTPGYIDLVKVTGVLPANTGVIVRMDAGEYEFTYSNGTPADVSRNLLRGSATNTYVKGLAYVLSNKNGIGLYKAELNKNATGGEGNTHFLNNANKAYLPDGTGSSNIASYSFRFGENTTAIENVEVENEVKAIYDLTGRRVEAITAPGIYIVGGKKVLVK